MIGKSDNQNQGNFLKPLLKDFINLGTDLEHSTQDGIGVVEQVIGQSIKIENVEARVGDQLRIKANFDKARKLLGYNPETTLF